MSIIISLSGILIMFFSIRREKEQYHEIYSREKNFEQYKTIMDSIFPSPVVIGKLKNNRMEYFFENQIYKKLKEYLEKNPLEILDKIHTKQEQIKQIRVPQESKISHGCLVSRQPQSNVSQTCANTVS